MTPQTLRSEADVFADLASLCRSPGYVHAFAHLCWRDNLVSYEGEMTPDDMRKLFTPDRLIRTELSTLLGLMAQSAWAGPQPGAQVVREYMERTDALMQELHFSMPGSMAQLTAGTGGMPDLQAFGHGMALREPIFYGGESAYLFQYRDFSLEKYAADDGWLLAHKGFEIADAHAVVKSLARLQDDKATQFWRAACAADDWLGVNLLPAFQFSLADVAERSGVAHARVEAALAALTLTHDNAAFKSLADFNAIYAQPLLPVPQGAVIQFVPYATAEALYESPFYWLMDDEAARQHLRQPAGLAAGDRWSTG